MSGGGSGGGGSGGVPKGAVLLLEEDGTSEELETSWEQAQDSGGGESLDGSGVAIESIREEVDWLDGPGFGAHRMRGRALVKQTALASPGALTRASLMTVG
jgi:hypothetical protein